MVTTRHLENHLILATTEDFKCLHWDRLVEISYSSIIFFFSLPLWMKRNSRPTFLISSILISSTWHVPTSSLRPYNWITTTAASHREGENAGFWRDPIEINETLGGVWPRTISRPVSKELTPRCSSMPVLRGTTQPQRYGFSVCNSGGISGHSLHN